MAGRPISARMGASRTGSRPTFSALPAQNATGNWVKVVQRLPVRLVLDEAAPHLSGGLSAKAIVDVRQAAAAR